MRVWSGLEKQPTQVGPELFQCWKLSQHSQHRIIVLKIGSSFLCIVDTHITVFPLFPPSAGFAPLPAVWIFSLCVFLTCKVTYKNFFENSSQTSSFEKNTYFLFVPNTCCALKHFLIGCWPHSWHCRALKKATISKTS